MLKTVRDAIDAGVRSGVAASLDSALDPIIKTVTRSLFDNPRYPFLAAAQLRLIEAGMKPVTAWDQAGKILRDFLDDEKIEFGDPRYDWSQAGARTLIEECEIAHWEKGSDDV